MNYEKVVTLFDTAEHAETAKKNLELAGFSSDDISLVSNKTIGSSGQALKEPGLWHKLFGQDIEQHEAGVYGRTVEGGGVVLTLRAPQDDVPKAMGILNAHDVVDVRDRAVDQGLAKVADLPKAAANPVPAPAPAVRAAATAAAVAGSKDEVIRLAEEQLSVGKRLVEQGTTRIRRFVTERPVEEKVTLHEEHADVVRRAISDPTSLQDIDWGDKTIEVRETAEEAVVNKTARVAEEVVVKKTGSDHVETVRDKVRRQQVEVEQLDASGNPLKADAAKKG